MAKKIKPKCMQGRIKRPLHAFCYFLMDQSNALYISFSNEGF